MKPVTLNDDEFYVLIAFATANSSSDPRYKALAKKLNLGVAGLDGMKPPHETSYPHLVYAKMLNKPYSYALSKTVEELAEEVISEKSREFARVRAEIEARTVDGVARQVH